MVDKLREIFERAQQQPEEEQRFIAEMVRREIEDQEWESSDDLRGAIEESNAEYAAGDALVFDEYDRQHSAAKDAGRPPLATSS